MILNLIDFSALSEQTESTQVISWHGNLGKPTDQVMHPRGVHMDQQLSLTSVVESAAKLPLVRINRTEFLTQNLRRLCTPEQLQKAIAEGTLQAGIPVATLDSLANAVINNETLKVTSISAAAGIPGGLAMVATVPADLAQFYGFVIRIAQELAYIYGWEEMFTETSSELDTATESQLILFISVMSGVGAANKVVSKLFGETAMKAVAKRIAAQALTKTWYYPIVKKIAILLGQRMVKETFARGVSKVVPVLGGVVSGALTLASFKPMAHKLKKHLSNLAHMTPEEYAAYEASIVIDADEATEVDTATETTVNVNFWSCVCGTENKGKFCMECGQAKPAGLPQYQCDKCTWEPNDTTQPPKYCPECGDPFDAGDIVLVG